MERNFNQIKVIELNKKLIEAINGYFRDFEKSDFREGETGETLNQVFEF